MAPLLAASIQNSIFRQVLSEVHGDISDIFMLPDKYKKVFMLIANVLCTYLLLLNSFIVNWATESTSTPQIIIIQ